jgi:hypothetical protein
MYSCHVRLTKVRVPSGRYVATNTGIVSIVHLQVALAIGKPSLTLPKRLLGTLAIVFAVHLHVRVLSKAA